MTTSVLNSLIDKDDIKGIINYLNIDDEKTYEDRYKQLINYSLSFNKHRLLQSILEQIPIKSHELQKYLLNEAINNYAFSIVNYVVEEYKIRVEKENLKLAIHLGELNISDYLLKVLDKYDDHKYEDFILTYALNRGFSEIYMKAYKQLYKPNKQPPKEVILTAVSYNAYDMIEDVLKNYTLDISVIKYMLLTSNDTYMFDIIYNNTNIDISFDNFILLRKYSLDNQIELVKHLIELYSKLGIDFVNYYLQLKYEHRKYLLEFYNISDIRNSNIDVGLIFNTDDIDISNYYTKEYMNKIEDRPDTKFDVDIDVKVDEKLIKDVIVKENLAYLNYILSIKPFERKDILEMFDLDDIVSYKDTLYSVLEDIFGDVNVDFVNMLIKKFITE